MRLSTLIPAVCLAFQSPLLPRRLTLRHGFTSIQTLFTGTIAKVASLVAIVIGGYGFAHGEPERRRRSPVLLPEQALPSLRQTS